MQPGDEEHFLQIGADEYLGPSGEIDDLVNHSCLPNSAVSIGNQAIMLVTTQSIAIGEEITFDYSMTSTESPDTWAMPVAGSSAAFRLYQATFVFDTSRRVSYLGMSCGSRPGNLDTIRSRELSLRTLSNRSRRILQCVFDFSANGHPAVILDDHFVGLGINENLSADGECTPRLIRNSYGKHGHLVPSSRIPSVKRPYLETSVLQVLRDLLRDLLHARARRVDHASWSA